MIRVSVSLTGSDAARAELDAIANATGPGGALMTVLGRGLANGLRSYYRERNRTPNKLGGERTNFWSAVAAAVQNPRAGTDAVEVAISHPHILQKFKGGTITPKNAKALSIPANAKSHGKSPRVFDHLAFIPSRTLGPGGPIGFLVEGVQKTSTRGKRKGQQIVVAKQGGSLLYVLTHSVHQDPDAETLPTDDRMMESILEAGRDYLKVVTESSI